MAAYSWGLIVVPAGVLGGFLLHWFTIRRIRDPEERLPYCRGAYLAFSLQLLLYAWAIFFLVSGGRPGAVLIPLGMTFSFTGDYFNLQFPIVRKRLSEPVFLGILCFAVAQIFYIAGFLFLIPLNELMDHGFLIPLLILFLAVPAAVFRLRIFKKERPKTLMRGGFLYGFALGAMVAVAVSATLVRGGYWCAVAVGALFFLVSDAVMGQTTLRGRHPSYEYQIPWGTYLAAQGLILFGTAVEFFIRG